MRLAGAELGLNPISLPYRIVPLFEFVGSRHSTQDVVEEGAYRLDLKLLDGLELWSSRLARSSGMGIGPDMFLQRVHGDDPVRNLADLVQSLAGREKVIGFGHNSVLEFP